MIKRYCQLKVNRLIEKEEVGIRCTIKVHINGKLIKAEAVAGDPDTAAVIANKRIKRIILEQMKKDKPRICYGSFGVYIRFQDVIGNGETFEEAYSSYLEFKEYVSKSKESKAQAILAGTAPATNKSPSLFQRILNKLFR